jgi:hypothetical protein
MLCCPQVTYVFLSRTARGSSARFASAAAASYLLMQADLRAAAAAAAPPLPAAGLSPTARGAAPASALYKQTSELDGSDYLSPGKRQRLSAGSLLRVESDVSDLVRCAGFELPGTRGSAACIVTLRCSLSLVGELNTCTVPVHSTAY